MIFPDRNPENQLKKKTKLQYSQVFTLGVKDFVWIRELSHQTNRAVISDGNRNQTPPCIESFLRHTALFCCSAPTTPDWRKVRHLLVILKEHFTARKMSVYYNCTTNKIYTCLYVKICDFWVGKKGINSLLGQSVHVGSKATLLHIASSSADSSRCHWHR